MIVFPAPLRKPGPRGPHPSHGPGHGPHPGHGQLPGLASQQNIPQNTNYEPSYAYDYPTYHNDASGNLLAPSGNSAHDQHAPKSEGGNFGTFVFITMIFIVLIIVAVVYVRKELKKSLPEGGETSPTSENTKL